MYTNIEYINMQTAFLNIRNSTNCAQQCSDVPYCIICNAYDMILNIISIYIFFLN